MEVFISISVVFMCLLVICELDHLKHDLHFSISLRSEAMEH